MSRKKSRPERDGKVFSSFKSGIGHLGGVARAGKRDHFPGAVIPGVCRLEKLSTLENGRYQPVIRTGTPRMANGGEHE